jgi:broad specificity phosphatase PhoE
MHLPVIREPDLCETSRRAWRGVTITELQAAFPGRSEKGLKDPVTFPAVGGEPMRAFAKHVETALEQTQQVHSGFDLLMVSHGGVIEALLCSVLSVDLRYLFWLKQDSTAIADPAF